MAEAAEIEIVAVRGSVRPGNYTSMALDLVVDELKSDARLSVSVIDPAKLTLLQPGGEGPSDAETLRRTVESATAVVLSTPEYHGSYSSAIKLVIENLGFPSVLAGKPVALIGVAAGRIGAIKALEHLRSVCSHVGAFVLPGPVSVAGVQQLFDGEGRCLDEGTERRLRGAAVALRDYIAQSICPRIALERMVREE